jgi:HlyD family secretion protein
MLDIDPKLRPGMSCNADIETETVFDVISVPLQSVTARTDIPEENGNDTTEVASTSGDKKSNGNGRNKEPKEVVFIMDNGTVKMVVVETGISDDDYLQVISGLEGEEEVVSGSYRAISRELEDGSKVRVEEKRGRGSKSEES